MEIETKGRAKGGLARAETLTPQERKEIAIKAATIRWKPESHKDSLPKATHRGMLVIGEIKIPCAVLDNGKRIITEHGITKAILGVISGASQRAKKAQHEGQAPLPLFLAPSNLKPFISEDLLYGPLVPISYRDNRKQVVGFDATILPGACDVWLRAREAKALQTQQLDKAQKAEILMRGLAHIGIIALVDEATGYQEVRDKEALQAILDAYLRKELAVWAKRFPDEFYQHIFRLRGWTWRGRGVNPPQVVATYTKDIVYARLAPHIIEELERRNPVEAGRRKSKHHQWLTDDIGHPALAQHLHAVITLMRVSSSWNQFKAMLDLAHPKKGDTLQLPLMNESPPSEPIENLPLFGQFTNSPSEKQTSLQLFIEN